MGGRSLASARIKEEGEEEVWLPPESKLQCHELYSEISTPTATRPQPSPYYEPGRLEGLVKDICNELLSLYGLWHYDLDSIFFIISLMHWKRKLKESCCQYLLLYLLGWRITPDNLRGKGSSSLCSKQGNTMMSAYVVESLELILLVFVKVSICDLGWIGPIVLDYHSPTIQLGISLCKHPIPECSKALHLYCPLLLLLIHLELPSASHFLYHLMCMDLFECVQVCVDFPPSYYVLSMLGSGFVSLLRLY
ncbi:uncharacterized protein LOC130760301 [Actinidia eriantha]|uniref:uncharacterized protein LOC130760301 n=1 Tax=Actinidia eriantha TaxID=165200 RepID=UPI0025853B4F|nr:uncharacterized protein LOC130760301 [Actinidia eriantha]